MVERVPNLAFGSNRAHSPISSDKLSYRKLSHAQDFSIPRYFKRGPLLGDVARCDFSRRACVASTTRSASDFYRVLLGSTARTVRLGLFWQMKDTVQAKVP